jgi:serine/threonine protein kinase
MADDRDERDPLDLVAEEFAEACRRGERPLVADFVARYPQWAEELRVLLPSVAKMEELKRLKKKACTVPVPESVELRQLGDFRILREVGRGGMGIVFEAVQESLGRRVALKVLPRHAFLDPKRLERFQREAQAAACLHHTNIVPVFGAGEQDGLSYYVMQFIEGKSLSQLVTEWRAGFDPLSSRKGALAQETGTVHLPRSGPEPAADAVTVALSSPSCDGQDPELSAPILSAKPRLSPGHYRIVAEIGVQAAEALHYAHKQGTLHRDVKPANLLLDRRGCVWITDFGLAKLVGQDQLTKTGDILGTLQYMAPECLRGEADARSDVYSLGLTLYEMLTLEPAFSDANPTRLMRRIESREPVAPAKLNPLLPRDLETIILTASARDPDARYPTAKALASDLQRFVADRPIHARRASLIERGWRWCRRNRLVAGLIAAASVSLLVAAASGWTGYVISRRALEREANKNEEAAKATQRAEESLELSLKQFEEVFNQFAQPDPGLSFGSPPPDQRRPSPDEHLSPKEAAVLKSVLKFYDQFAQSNSSNPRLRREAGRAHQRVANLYQQMRQYDQAAVAWERTIKIYESLCADFPEDHALRFELAEAYSHADVPAAETERSLLSETRLRTSIELFAALARQDPGDPEYPQAQARALGRLGWLFFRRQQMVEAESTLRKALDMLKTLGNPTLRPPHILAYDLGKVRLALADVLQTQMRWTEARVILDEAIRAVQVYADGGSASPLEQLLGDQCTLMAEVLRHLGDNQGAADMARRAEELVRSQPLPDTRGTRPGRGDLPPPRD